MKLRFLQDPQVEMSNKQLEQDQDFGWRYGTVSSRSLEAIRMSKSIYKGWIRKLGMHIHETWERGALLHNSEQTLINHDP